MNRRRYRDMTKFQDETPQAKPGVVGEILAVIAIVLIALFDGLLMGFKL